MTDTTKDMFKNVIDRLMFMQCAPQDAIEHDVLLNALFALSNQHAAGSIVLSEERLAALNYIMARAGIGKLVTIFGGSANLTPETVAKAKDAALKHYEDDAQLTQTDMERVACVACGAHIGCSCIVPNPGVLGVASVDGRYYHIWRRKLALMERTRIVETARKNVGDAVAEHAGGLARAAAHDERGLPSDVSAAEGRRDLPNDEVKTWQLSMGEIMAMPCLACGAGSGVSCEGYKPNELRSTVFVRTRDEHAWCHEERLTAAACIRPAGAGARVESEQAQPGEDNLDQGDGLETDELAQRRRAAVARSAASEPLLTEFAEVTHVGDFGDRRVALSDGTLALEEIERIVTARSNDDALSQGWDKSIAMHPDELEQINDERKDRDDLIKCITDAAKHHDRLGSKYEAHGNATGAAQLRAVGGLLWSINNERKFYGVLPDAPTKEPELDLSTAGLRARIEVVVERELRRYGGVEELADFSSVSVLIAGAVADMLEGGAK